jgi:hypothetical protein
MGEKDGIRENPKAEDKKTIFDLLKNELAIQEALAAIAGDSVSDPEQIVASSITFAATTTAPDAGIVVAVNMNDAADTCRVAHYNGVQMVYVDETQFTSGPRQERLSAFYNIATTTGTFNVVATCTGPISAGLDAKALTYTGVDQTNMLNTYKKYHSNGVSTSTISTSATTTVDDTWSVSALRNQNGPLTSNTNCDVKTVDGASICDSNGPVGVAGQYQTVAATSFAGGMAMVTLFIAPSAGGGGGGIITPLQDIIWFD